MRSGTLIVMEPTHNKKVRASTKIRKRGRPRQFDCSEALESAQRTFEREGYSDATLDDLAAAMGINRPSLYAAFTDKKTLYMRALDLYAERMCAKFTDALKEDDFPTALRSLYNIALDAYLGEDGEVVGCMVACTAVTPALRDDGIRSQTKSIMDDIDAIVGRRIARAVNEQALSNDTNVATLSQLVVGVLHTLALRARAGESRKVLDELADNAVAALICHR